MLAPVVVAVAASASACATYRAGSFQSGSEPFVGERTQAGCLDLAIDVKRDPVATGPVVQYQFGNRCDRSTTIDLAAVEVTGRTASGAEVAMVAYDPYDQIRALPLDARGVGRERIEYRTAREFGGDVIAVCVAIGSLGMVEPKPGMEVTCQGVEPVARVAESRSATEVAP